MSEEKKIPEDVFVIAVRDGKAAILETLSAYGRHRGQFMDAAALAFNDCELRPEKGKIAVAIGHLDNTQILEHTRGSHPAVVQVDISSGNPVIAGLSIVNLTWRDCNEFRGTLTRIVRVADTRSVSGVAAREQDGYQIPPAPRA
ncbi:MAG: hypothetical protein M3O22_04250 [Pseudomonadota bacterium]|nr:hypothetical protein [Pseudomonadota bacterium]